MNSCIPKRFFAGVAVLAAISSAVVTGCNPQVDYAPKPSRTSASPGKAASGKSNAESTAGSTKTTEIASATAGVNTATPMTSSIESAIIAFDEFDGVHRGGWKEPGLGEWSNIGVERDGALVVAGDADVYRELAKPVTEGVLWYAVTMRMESPVTGIASVDGSPGPPKRFGKLGFSAIDKPFTSRGFWMETDRDTKIENTELQTFLTRFSFDVHNSEGYAGRNFGMTLIDSEGMMLVRPRVKMIGNFAAHQFSHLSLKKSGPEKLIVERVAIARSAEAALASQAPVMAPRPGAPAPVAATAEPKDAAGAAKEQAGDATPEAKAGQPAAQPAPTDEKSEPKSEPKTEEKAEPKPEAKDESKAEAKSEPKN